MNARELISRLRELDPDTPVLTSGYEGGLTTAGFSTLEVQELDRGDAADWLGEYESVEEAHRLATTENKWNPEGPPKLVGEPIVAAVVYREVRDE